MTYTQCKKYLGKVVEACWSDAHSIDAWTPLEELMTEALPCRTYGIVAAVTEDGMTISASLNGAGEVGGSWHIPRAMLTLVTVLK